MFGSPLGLDLVWGDMANCTRKVRTTVGSGQCWHSTSCRKIVKKISLHTKDTCSFCGKTKMKRKAAANAWKRRLAVPGPHHPWCPHREVALETKGTERTVEATPLETSPAYNKRVNFYDNYCYNKLCLNTVNGNTSHYNIFGE